MSTQKKTPPAKMPLTASPHAPNFSSSPRAKGEAGGKCTSPQLRAFPWKSYLAVLIAIALGVVVLVLLKSVLTPFIAGALLAYLASPIVRGLVNPKKPRRFKFSRTLAALFATVLLMAFCALVFFLLVPLIQSEVAAIQSRLPDLWNTFSGVYLPRLEAWLGITFAPNLETARQFLTEHLGDLSQFSQEALARLKSGGNLFLTWVVNLVLTPVVMFYCLKDGHLWTHEIKKLVPPRATEKTRLIAGEIHQALSEFIRGQALVMLALAAYYSIALKVVGLPFAWSIGLLSGILVFIPYVGFTLGLTLAALTALLQPIDAGTLLLFVVGVYGVGQILEGYVLTPYLIGDKIGLHPLAVIFALLAFGELFGFVGLLAALPMSAVVLIAWRHLRAAYLKSAVYQGKT